MEDEEGYMVLEKRNAAGSRGPLRGAGFSLQDHQAGVPAGAPRCPRCLLRALMVTLLLTFMGCMIWLVAQRGHPEGTTWCGNTSLGCGCATSGCVFPELRKSLCPLRESEGCVLCPPHWWLRGTKCYWVSDGVNPWSGSQRDCVARRAQLLMLGDQEELDFLNHNLRKPSRYFWLGLSAPSAGEGWTWLNGSHPDQSRFQVSPWERGDGACGVLRGDRIGSSSCTSRLQWICQKEATKL